MGALAVKGRMVTLGGAGAVFEVDSKQLLAKELDVLGSRYVTYTEIIEALELVARGEIWPVGSETRPLNDAEAVHELVERGDVIGGRGGLVYFVKDIEVGPWDLVDVHLGYDGPVKVWWNGQEVFTDPGTSPAVEDATSLRLKSRHGTNRLALALDTRNGQARGIYARWERTWAS